MKNKNSTTAIPLQHSVEMRMAWQVGGLRGKALREKFPQYSRATVYKHAKKPIGEECRVDGRRSNRGRPRKLSERDCRRLNRTIGELREREGTFTSKRLQLAAGLSGVGNRTVRRALNKSGYHYCRSRKKGLLRADDLPKRLKFCKALRKDNRDQSWWNHTISFYLDGKGFIYKQNPLDQATAPHAREWRKRSEGLVRGCTAKGAKEGARKALFMVGISYQRGVVLCEQYFGAISGEKFAKLADQTFKQAFDLSINPQGRNFLQDGDPSQNSRMAHRVFEKLGANVIAIPPRSPDLNPIENFFHLVQMKLDEDTKCKQIKRETFEEFSNRVRGIMVNFPRCDIDKIIESMDKRVTMIINARGNRIKY